MKKLFLSIIAGIGCLASVYSQSAVQFIDINNVKARVTNIGSLFYDGNQSGFLVPKTGSKSTIFSASPWIGGMHNGDLYMMAETYRQSGRDMQQGPVEDVYYANHLMYWDRIWKINKTDLQAFRDSVTQSHTPSTTLYRDIYEWPARGNVIGGDTSRDFAPFVDVDGDRLYDPLKGDYPSIKGDQCLYTIMNDDTLHTESSGKKMRLEIHRTVYAYNQTGPLNNSIFVDYRIINKSTRTYDSLLFSSFVDFDLGKYDDDFIGTDTALNMIYAYNGDPTDEPPMGYGANPPAQACVLLNHKLLSSMYYNNHFGAVTGNPSSAMDYYHFMQGKWKDGSEKHAADSGFGSSAPTTPFSFGGDPCASTGWWEGGVGIPPGDRRILGTIDLVKLAPEESLDVSLAFVYARASGGGNIASVCALKGAVDTVLTWYKNGGPTTGIFDRPEQELSFKVYPNPAKQTITIDGADVKNATVTIYDITGKEMQSQVIQQSQTLSLNNLRSGIYFVRVTTEKGTATNRLVVE